MEKTYFEALETEIEKEKWDCVRRLRTCIDGLFEEYKSISVELAIDVIAKEYG